MKKAMQCPSGNDFRLARMAAILLAFSFIGTFYGCKNRTKTESQSEAEMAPESAVASSSAAAEKPAGDRKFVRTADLRFKVKDVAKSTYAIENATAKFGGFVTYTHLESKIAEKDQSQISPDSILQTTRYNVENNITIRVPNASLDTVVKSIAREVAFLDYRVIKADDVSLQILSNQMAQSRSAAKETRLANAIDAKGKKLNDITLAEDHLDSQKENRDAKRIENADLADKISFSTLTLQLYQNETLKSEVVVSAINPDLYRPTIGAQLLESLKSGWFILENILAFVVRLWSLLLLLLLCFWLYRKYLRLQKA